MNCIHITSLDDAGLEPYCRMTEPQLRNKLHVDCGLFVAESPKVIAVALQAGYEPVSLLCEERHIALVATYLFIQANAKCWQS